MEYIQCGLFYHLAKWGHNFGADGFTSTSISDFNIRKTLAVQIGAEILTDFLWLLIR